MNDHAPTVRLDIPGRDHPVVVVFNMGTLASIEAATGKTIDAVTAAIGPAFAKVAGESQEARKERIAVAMADFATTSNMRLFVAGCLRQTPDEVDSMVPVRSFRRVHNELWAGFLAAIVDLLGGDQDDPAPKVASPGPSGSGSPASGS